MRRGGQEPLLSATFQNSISGDHILNRVGKQTKLIGIREV
jgi:hypothetical protein